MDERSSPVEFLFIGLVYVTLGGIPFRAFVSAPGPPFLTFTPPDRFLSALLLVSSVWRTFTGSLGIDSHVNCLVVRRWLMVTILGLVFNVVMEYCLNDLKSFSGVGGDRSIGSRQPGS